MQTQELVTLVPWTLIAQILNLFLQIYLIKRFLFKPINEIIEKRRKLATQDLDDAKKSKEEAKALKDEYEASIANAKDKANEIIASAKSSAESRSEEIISEANKEAAAIKNKAELDIQQERKKAINDIKNEIGSMAVDIAGKVIEREVSEDDHRKLIDEFIENVGE